METLQDDLLACRRVSFPLRTLTIEEQTNFMSRILGLMRLKFAWVAEPPFSIVGVATPAKAQEFIDKYDAMKADGHAHHRVSDFFCGSGQMSLRSDMEAYARSGELSERLCIEIVAYGAIMLDDTWAEAVHKYVTSISR